jgi:carbon monoxide dehydrogenase subunit G
MGDVSKFESRRGVVDCTPQEVYSFVTDIRNFSRFVPEGRINNLKIEPDECSFSVSMIGNVNFRIDEKTPYSKVVFSGSALQSNNFTLELHIEDSVDHNSYIKIFLEADMNPIVKMMANEPVKQFLESLVTEMENFTDWGNTSA